MNQPNRTQAPADTSVVNIRHQEKFDVYIGRSGLGFDGYYGNPYRLGRDGGRQEVIEKFRKYFYKRLEKDEEFRKNIAKLKGMRLGCFCSPRTCHGDVIAGFLNGIN